MTKKEDITYEGYDKHLIRKNVTKDINEKHKKDKTTSYLDFYGAGESYKYISKRTKANILSIDNNPKIAKRFKNNIQTRFISLKNLCIEALRKFNIMWLDYCGTLNDSVEEELSLLPRIMRNKGTLYITLRMGREHDYFKGTSRSRIEREIITTICHHLAKNNIKATWKYTVKYKSIAKTKGKRKCKAPTAMKLYKFTWIRVKTKTFNIPIIKDEFKLVTEMN